MNKDVFSQNLTFFVKWIWGGLTDLQKEDPNAFYPFNYRIGHSDNFITDLGRICNTFPKEAQMKFKKAVAINMQLHPGDRMKLRWLLELSSEIKNIEILVAINYWINSGWIYIIESREEFFALVLNTVASIASETKEVAHTLRKLVRTELFSYKYAPLVLVALCQAEPENFLEHLELLRKYFKELQKKRENKQYTYMTAQHITQTVSADIIAESLWKMREEDKWLIKAFFVGKKCPLKIVKKN